MTFVNSIIMAFAMFSKIPMPHIEWEDKSMRYMLAFFPLVGVVIAVLLGVWLVVCGGLGAGSGLFAAGLTLIPLALTSGIHLDGLIDTADALGSHAEPERKREILKDSRVGAFGVIAVAAYLVAYFGLCLDLPMTARAVGLLGCAHVLSRVSSGSISMLFDKSDHEGLLSTFKGASEKRGGLVILGVFGVLTVVVALCLNWRAAVLMVVFDALCVWWIHHTAVKQFEGFSGDLAGCFLQLAEVAMLLGVVIAL